MLISGCDNFTGPDKERVIGTVTGFEPDDPQWSVADTVQPGDTVTVSVQTYGDGCFEKGGTEVEVDGLEATVTPYDIHVDRRCVERSLKTFNHVATVRFDSAGTARVTLRGRTRPLWRRAGEVVTFDQTVTVR